MKRSIMGLAVVLIGAASRPTLAQVATQYDPTHCLAQDKTTNGLTTLVRGTNSITNNTGGTVTLVCPIDKQTSGPGISNDAISLVQIPLSDPNNAGVNCGFQVFQSLYANLDTSSNFIDSHWQNSVGTGTMSISDDTGVPNGYWNLGDGTGNTVWMYADLSCILPNGTGISGKYTITENGSSQPTQIFSSSKCTADSLDDHDWEYNSTESFSAPGGFIYANSNSLMGGHFVWDCAVPNGVSVEFALGQDAGNNTNGCNLDNSNLSTLTWSVPSTTGSQASMVIPLTKQGLIAVPATGSHNMNCGSKLNQVNGDGQIVTYRTQPGALSRTGWAVSASKNSSTAGSAIDGSLTSRWTSGTGQNNGQQWFQVDFGSAKVFRSIRLDAAGSANDYPHGYQVVVSNDGTNWSSPVASGAGSGGLVVIDFSPQNARYVRVIQTTNSDTHWWSIYELNIFG
jgi:hypothetical protein